MHRGVRVPAWVVVSLPPPLHDTNCGMDPTGDMWMCIKDSKERLRHVRNGRRLYVVNNEVSAITSLHTEHACMRIPGVALNPLFN